MTLDLSALIGAAQAVPTVTVPPGVYPAQVLHGAKPDAPVRIICAGVTFAGLALSDCANLTFEGLGVVQPPVPQGFAAVKLQGCVSVGLVNPKISGTADPVSGLYMGKAVQVLGGSHVSITGAEIFGFFKGVNPAVTDDFTLSGCDLHHIRTSPVDGYGQRLSIIDNHIHDIIPSGADHSDGIHIFTKGQTAPCDGLSITGNRMEMGGVSAVGTLGINLEGTAQSWFTNVKVSDNILRWNNNQGITINYVQSGEIRGNILTPGAGLDNPAHAPSIIVQNRHLGPPGALIIAENSCKKIASFNPAYGVNTYLTAAKISQMGAPDA